MQKYFIFGLGGIVLFLFAIGWMGSIDIAKGDSVTVSGNVTSTVSCNSATTTTAFGTLTVASVFTSSPNVTTTVSCNSGAGCTLSVNDAGNSTSSGLYKSAVPSYILPSNTATLSAGNEGYGIQATTTAAGSGGSLVTAGVYNKEGNAVGALSIGSLTLASSSAAISGREVVVAHKAAISGLTSAGSYSDTITYSCVGN